MRYAPIVSAPGYEADDQGHIWSVQTNWRGYGRRAGLIVRPDPGALGTPLVSQRLLHGGIIHEVRLGLGDWVAAERALVEIVTTLVTGRASAP